ISVAFDASIPICPACNDGFVARNLSRSSGHVSAGPPVRVVCAMALSAVAVCAAALAATPQKRMQQRMQQRTQHGTQHSPRLHGRTVDITTLYVTSKSARQKPHLLMDGLSKGQYEIIFRTASNCGISAHAGRHAGVTRDLWSTMERATGLT